MSERDYSKGKVYKIVVNTEEEYKPYVGSTVEELSRRMSGHRAFYKSWKNGKGSHIKSYDLFDKFGVENCKIILLEEYPCDSKMKLLMKEREWFDKMECCNKIRPFISNEERIERMKEYYDTNREILLEQKKEYGQKNKNKIAEKSKIYYEANKEEIAKKDKIYREAHKEQILIRNRNYYKANKEKILQQKKEYYLSSLKL
jgi:molybdopterin converting factor small subunit